MGESQHEERVAALEERVAELEQRLRALGACVDELAAALALGRGQAPSQPVDDNGHEARLASAAMGALNTEHLPEGLRAVIRLVREGKANQAQRDLYNLPEADLQAHQDVVAMIATALFIQRGDFNSAKKVLASAVQATNDARLAKLLTLVEQYAAN